jgi:hypothetical protein
MFVEFNCMGSIRRMGVNSASRRFRRGSVLIYSLLMMVIMLAMTSFAVDYGRMQLIKTQLQRNADSTARGSLEMYIEGSSSDYTYWGPAMTWSRFNPVDNNSGVSPTVSFTWGYWNSTSKTFTAGTGTPVAVQVTVSRTAANGNPVPLTFPLMNGLSGIRTTCDVSATAIAVLSTSTSVTNQTISGQSDLWLAGMPNGTGPISDGDTAPSQSPPLVMSVTPGTVLTLTNVSGAVKHDPTLSADSPDGYTAGIYGHNSDWTSEPAVEDNIGNIYAPIDSLIGVFLTSSAPNTQSAPTATLDYTTQAARDTVNTTGLQVQEPFYIGNGETSTGTTKTFVVPPGATRLYLGTMDGHQWANNSGSFTATINQLQQVYLVK